MLTRTKEGVGSVRLKKGKHWAKCGKCGLIRVPPEKISEAPDLWIRASSGTITLPMPMPIEDRFKNTHPKYYCHNCGKWWEGGDTRISCAVYHSVGDCCHYGQTEVKP